MPRKKPTAMVVVAILQIVFGSLALLSPVLYFAGAQRAVNSFAAMMPNGPNQSGMTPEQTQAELERRLPWLSTYTNGANAVELLIAVLMIGGGIGLLKIRGWGRWLTIVYVPLSVLSRVAGTVVAATWILPVTVDLMKAQIRLMKPASGGPPLDPEAFGNLMGIIMTVVVILSLLLLAYPIFVLVVMMLPSTRAAFGGQSPAAEPEDYRDSAWGEGREPPDEGHYRTQD